MTHEEFIKSAKRRKAFALLLTTGLAPVFGCLYAGPAGAFWACTAWIVFVVLPRTTGTRLLGFAYRSFFAPDQLPWTMVNLVLAILIGCMQFGMDVAFYAALVGVPIVVLTLILAVMEPDIEAEQVPVAVAPPAKDQR